MYERLLAADAVHRLLRCTYLSEYDKIAYNTIYGFSCEDAYIDALNCLGAEEVRGVAWRGAVRPCLKVLSVDSRLCPVETPA